MYRWKALVGNQRTRSFKRYISDSIDILQTCNEAFFYHAKYFDSKTGVTGAIVEMT